LRPAEMSDGHLRGRLWELIYALAGRRIFLSGTDHLDDRALYEWLDAFLDDDCADCPLDAETNCRLDVSEGRNGTAAGTQTWLRSAPARRTHRRRAHATPLGTPPQPGLARLLRPAHRPPQRPRPLRNAVEKRPPGRSHPPRTQPSRRLFLRHHRQLRRRGHGS